MARLDFEQYWSKKTDSDHSQREGFDVFRIAASEIQAFHQPQLKRVLDIGCGAGEVYAHLGAARGEHYLGVDFSASQLATFQSQHPDVRLAQGDVSTYSTAERFDFIIVNNVIQYCTPSMTQQALKNLSAMLAPGGRLVLGNVPQRSLRASYHQGLFSDRARPRLRALLRKPAIVASTLLRPVDRVGHWYEPSEFRAWANALGMTSSFFGCLLYRYRFTAVLSHGEQPL
jgi:SAM-dependent methyltransferase